MASSTHYMFLQYVLFATKNSEYTFFIISDNNHRRNDLWLYNIAYLIVKILFVKKYINVKLTLEYSKHSEHLQFLASEIVKY